LISEIKHKQIVIDSTNLFWRSISSCIKKAKESDDTFVYTHVIVDFIDRVKRLKSQFGYTDSIIYLLFDNPKSRFTTRQLIDEHYKSHRCDASIPKEFWDTLALLTLVLKCYSNDFVIMQLEDCEADDMVYPLIMQKCNEKNNMLLISVDLDWARGISLSNNVNWFNYTTLFWNKEIFKEQYGFYPERNKIKFFKTIRGDKSDDIEVSIPNMPANVLNHILDTYDDIQVFIDRFNRDDEIPQQWKMKILENRSKILSNYSLVDFISIEQDINEYSTQCKENINELKYWYRFLDLPLETRMKNKEEKKTQFFKKAKFPRIHRFDIKK
jgi:hypothetical protein